MQPYQSIILSTPSEFPLQTLHEVAIIMILITRGESVPHTGSELELDDDAQRCCWLVVGLGSS